MLSSLAAAITAFSLQFSDLNCLAINIYHEARNQPVEGQFAIAEVVLNRTKDRRWPSSICGVVTQKYKSICQFSWFCDNKTDRPKDKVAWKQAQDIAILASLVKTNYTDGALFYHSKSVSPSWARNMVNTISIKDHVFYKG
ncbi:cell wall hydrolase [bacterium]|nr:cell wall hydrolase [bacterium]